MKASLFRLQFLFIAMIMLWQVAGFSQEYDTLYLPQPEKTGNPPWVSEAALNLIYVADYSKLGDGDENKKLANANASTGFIGQNVYLFCASEGLSTVIRGSVDRNSL